MSASESAGVLADDVEGAELAAFHGLEHAREVQCRGRGDRRPQAASKRARASPGRRRPGTRAACSGSAPMSPPPCTLFWPRSGTSPTPAADVAGEQRQVDSASTLSTALWCSVMPSVQQDLGLVGPGVGVASSRMSSAGIPVISAGRARGVGLDRRGEGGEALGGPVDEVRFASPAWMISRAIACWRARCRCRPRGPARRRRTSPTPCGGDRCSTWRAPLSMPLHRWWKKMGCASRALEPHSTMTSVSSTSGRRRAATGSEDCRQTDDGGSVSSSVAAVDVVGPHHHPGESMLFVPTCSHVAGSSPARRSVERTSGPRSSPRWSPSSS
jgi:hypothetical protein